MTTVSDPKLPGKERSYLTAFLKFLFFLIALVGVLLTILFNMGGNSEVLKSSLEGYIREVSGGRPVNIQKLNRLSFFPAIGVDFEKLEIKETPASSNNMVSAEKIKIFVTFWGLVIKETALQALLVENMIFNPGAFGSKIISIEKLFIDHDKGTQDAKVLGKGKFGSLDWKFSMGIEVAGGVGKYTYYFGKMRPISMDVDTLHAEGTIVEQISDYIRIDGFKIGLPEPIIDGDISVSLLEGRQVKLKGRIQSESPVTVYKPDLNIDYSKKPAEITGTIEVPELIFEKLSGPDSIVEVFNKLHQVFSFDGEIQKTEKKEGPETQGQKVGNPFLCSYNFDVKISISKSLNFSEKTPGPAQIHISNKGGILELAEKDDKIEPFKGLCHDLKILQYSPR